MHRSLCLVFSILFLSACEPTDRKFDGGFDEDAQVGEEADPGADKADGDGDAGDSILDGDTETGPAIWCATQWPHATATAAGYHTESLYAQLWVEGVTPSGGQDSALEVELGMGPPQIGPAEPAWSWTAAEFNPNCAACGDKEEWMGSLQLPVPGDFAWAARVRYQTGAWVYCDRADDGRLGSSDGWSAADAPRITVSAPGSLRVLSLNLRCLLDNWTQRLPILVAGIAAIDPDLLGFQEVCAVGNTSDNLAELLSALEASTGKNYQVIRTVTHLSWDKYDEGLAVVSPHRIASSQVVDLPAGLFPRRAILSRVITPQGPLVFATTHLDHQSSTVRAQQVQALEPALATFAQDHEATLLTGDFNEAPGGTVSATLTQANFTDVWAALHPNQDGFTFPSSQPEIRIDYLWLKPTTSDFAPESIDRIFTIATDGVYASDHIGISAQVTR